ncbi:S24 family peptidase [Candidatus Thiothrix sp. Deng01]|uniref:S24 family peptidase n=1 Tax=Candidatus Thiothrix phosphatis TaxID=3112415 RepID=A0ABU6D3R6_9GAMM|nr:S24 family peptidase [Candidatus Thiothrix sp. Deng01]MEB4592953.1 S24 family peptidase [Candidatus Thiothrix sp. Deng01]
MTETRISIETFKQNLQPDFRHGGGMGELGSCAEAEPFALQVTDDSMEPEFAKGCIILIDPTGIARDGAYVFAVDYQGEYIFRQLRIIDGRHILAALNENYPFIEISGLDRVEGVITQRAGKRRSYHKRYDQ